MLQRARGHDDYHEVDDTGFFQLFAKKTVNAPISIWSRTGSRELALNPGIIAQDGFPTSHVIESLYLPERDLIRPTSAIRV